MRVIQICPLVMLCGLFAHTSAAQEASRLTMLAIPPELPRVDVDTSLATPTGREIMVRRGANLQKAINQAKRGDTIRLDPAGEWPAIVLPEKKGEGWIHIESMGTGILAGRR